MSNRVEELERNVSELQAAVDGLTEELVETKERLRRLEDEVEVDVVPNRRQTAETADGTPEQAEEAKSDETEEADDEESGLGDDNIIVA